MSKSLQKTLRTAESILKGCLHLPPSERIKKFQEFLKIENLRLLSLHRSEGGGREVARRRSTMMDTLLSHLFQIALRSIQFNPSDKNDIPSQLSLVATGGYGRGELNPYSDVDILFLIRSAKGTGLAQINAVVEQVLYMLWDLGLKVGHATRTIRECVEQGRKDMHSRTALMEARYLEGSKSIFEELQKNLISDLEDKSVQYIRDRMVDQDERHKKYGGTVFVQEPNVKNGCGGLRDLQNFLWIAQIKYNTSKISELYNKGILPQIEAGRLRRAYDFLMRVRNELHYRHGHATDEISLSFQPKIAEALGYRQKDVLLRIETFMRDYYRHARDIFIITESITRRIAQDIQPDGKLSTLTKLFQKPQKVEKLDQGLHIKNGVIKASKESSFPEDAHDLLQIFRTAQIRQAEISTEVHSIIRRQLKLVNRRFLYSKKARDIFLAILHSKGEVGRTLRSMHECGLLGEYIPEFGHLDCLVQHEFYHRYTADEHTLVAIEKLDEILNAKTGASARYSPIFKQLENPHLLYLAILLHDTGKAHRVRHHADASSACAQQVARRFCMDYESKRTLIWLVDHHITLSSVAQRRDTEDPATIKDIMELVETRQRLDMLHLLTFVDGLAVGSDHWNEWRQSILWKLYDSTANALNTSGVEQVNIQSQKEKLRTEVEHILPSGLSREELESHFTHMPQRYWGRTEKQEVSWHLEIIHEFFLKLASENSDATAPIIRWKHFPDRGYSEAVICTWDRSGLFAKIAGSFAAARLNILSADIYTRSDDIVLDIFQVCDSNHHAIKEGTRTSKMASVLSESLSGKSGFSISDQITREYQFMHRIPYQDEERFPTSIIINNEDSPEYTILEIQTPDRLGLLYRILGVLNQCGTDIYLAKINTENGAAMDVFYLTNSEGLKLTPELFSTINEKLRNTIDAINQPFRP